MEPPEISYVSDRQGILHYSDRHSSSRRHYKHTTPHTSASGSRTTRGRGTSHFSNTVSLFTLANVPVPFHRHHVRGYTDYFQGPKTPVPSWKLYQNPFYAVNTHLEDTGGQGTHFEDDINSKASPHHPLEESTDAMASEKMSTAAALTSILQRLRFVEENQVKSMALLRTLRLELEDACGRLQELEYSHKEAVGEINSVLQQYGTQMSAMSRRKEQEKIRTAFLHLQEEMEGEKEACRLLRLQNKKLSKELHLASRTAASACQELEQERKARELMEDVCDELAKEIGRDKAEVEHLKKEQEKVKGSLDEREMLKVAALHRSEVTLRAKHCEGQVSKLHADDNGGDCNANEEHINDQHPYDQHGLALHDLKGKLEAFVSTVGSTCHGSREDLERQVEQAAMLRQALDRILSQEVDDSCQKEEDYVANSQKLKLESSHLTLPHHNSDIYDRLEENLNDNGHEEKITNLPLPYRAPMIDHQTTRRIIRVRRGASTHLRRTMSHPAEYDAIQPLPSCGHVAASKEEDECVVTGGGHTGDGELSKEHLMFDPSNNTHAWMDKGEHLGMGTNVCNEDMHRVISHDLVASESKFCSFSDQEAGQSCSSSCKNDGGRAGHRKQLSLQYDSAGHFSVSERQMVCGGVCARPTNDQVLKSSSRHADEGEEVEEQEDACIEGEVGYTRLAGVSHGAKCGGDGHVDDHGDADADADADDCEDFYFEPIRHCPAQGSNSRSMVNDIIADDGQGPSASKGAEESANAETSVNLGGTPSTVADSNIAGGGDLAKSSSSSRSQSKEPLGSVNSTCFTPLKAIKHGGDNEHPAQLLTSCTAKYSTHQKCSQDEAMGNKQAAETCASLKSWGQSSSSTSRPVACFWPSSPTNYASIFGGGTTKSGGSAIKQLPPPNKCQLEQKYPAKVPSTNKIDHLNSKYDNSVTSSVSINIHGKNNNEYDINDDDVGPQQQQQQQQPSQMVKNNSLRAQLIEARQLESTDAIKTEYSTRRFRFSPLRSRPTR